MGGLALRSGLAAVVSLLLLTPALANTTFDFVFDDGGSGELPPAIAPFIGSGTVTIADDPGDGTFALTALGPFSMSFTFGTDTFSTSDIQTPLSEILVVLSGPAGNQQFRFSNTNSFGSGPEGGSIDLVNSFNVFLSFEPPGAAGFFGGNLTLYAEGTDPNNFSNDNSGNYLGTESLATPIPAAFPLFATGLGALGLLGWRRKRKNVAAIVA